ncbi:AraC family transcriptional regulator [Peribacillus sp. NPDC097225]|uniref:AraC family transcriptional regulator n=1 Tax=Peribacillus sp. NPDC097225 TaxID=3364400 RepID=UPI00380ADC09
MNKKAIRKSFSLEKLFPFEIVYKDTKNPQNELPNHFHEWYEIVYVYKGSGTFFIDQSIQYMSEGDLFILPGSIIHHATPDKDNPITSTAIFFDPLLISHRNFWEPFSLLQIFEECVKSKSFKYSLEPQQREVVMNYLEQLHNESIENKLGAAQAMIIQLQSMLLYLSRTKLENTIAGNEGENALPIWLKHVLNYIEGNFNKQSVDLYTLSTYAQISPEHLSRVFKQMTGMNISEYITTKKILYAKEQLLHTNDTVETVAKESGFNSMPHFHRTFKKFYGMTPANYRKH